MLFIPISNKATQQLFTVSLHFIKLHSACASHIISVVVWEWPLLYTVYHVMHMCVFSKQINNLNINTDL